MPETDDLANVEIDTTRMIGWLPPKSEHVLSAPPVMGHLGMKPELVVPEGGDDETRGTNSVELAHLAEAATKETRDFGATLRHSGEGSEVADRVRAPATSKLGGDHDRGRLERERPLGATVEGGLDRERALDLGLSLSRERERVLEAALEAAMAQVEQLTARLQDE